MAEVTYMFGDVLTGRIIQEIRVQGVSVNTKLDGSEYRGTFHLDQPGKTNDSLVSATIPGRCFCVMERDAQIIGDFLLTSRTYQAQAKSVQLFGKGFRAYPHMRVIEQDQSFIDVDQISIFRTFWLNMLADANAPDIEPPVFASTAQLRTLEILATELRTYGAAIDSLADGDNGFDWTVDTVRNEGVYTRKVRWGYPTIGSKSDSVAIQVFEYPGNIFNYWETSSIGSSGTHLFTAGGGEGESMPIVTVVHADLISGGHPRIDVTSSHKDIADLDILTSIATQEAHVKKAPGSVIKVEVKEAFYGNAIGDTCRLIIKDPRYPNKFQQDTRVIAAEYYPPQSGNVEMTRLSFEGDEDGSSEG